MKRIYLFFTLFMCLCLPAFSQSVTLVTPNGGETLPGASLYTIQWTSFNVDNIKIEYSTDNGSNWNVIASAFPTSALKYAWTVPIAPSTSCLVKITDILDNNISDVSNAPFTIPASVITLASPNGGETFTRGELKTITWNSVSVDLVKIEFSGNNGIAWTTLKASHPAIHGFFNWPVPATATSQGLIRVTMVSNAAVTDESNSAFTILAPPSENINQAKYHGGSYDGYSMATNLPSGITLMAPNGGENISGSTGYNISWVSGHVENVKIEFSDNNGASWSVLAASVSAYPNFYTWTVPVSSSTQCKIKVSSVEDPSVSDESNSTFSIIPALIDLISPAGGEAVYTGSVLPMTWNTSSITNIRIEYSLDLGANWITSQASYPASRKYYNWTAPQTVSGQVLFRISDATTPATADVTTVPVSLMAMPVSDVRKYHGGSYDGYSMANNEPAFINLLTPDGGQMLNGNTTYAITWVSNNVSNLKIELSTNNSSSWTTIAANVTSYPNSYNWTVSTTPSTQCRIRVTDLNNGSVVDQSSAVFTITNPQIVINQPSAAVTVFSSSVLPVEWTSVSVTNVKIEYSINNGTSWVVSEASYPATRKYYNWVAPSSASTQALIRVTDASNVLLGDTTASAFTIVASPVADVRKYHGGSYDGYGMSNNIVTILSPNGNENFTPGTTETIEWVINENINTLALNEVKIEYSVNGGASWITIESNYSSGSTTYSWNVPNNPSSQCKIRITDLSSGTEADISDNLFVIASTGTPPAPGNLDLSLSSPTTIEVTWSDHSSDETGFYLERSTDQTNWTVIPVAANETSYSDAGLQPNTNYYYRIQSYNASGSSAYTASENILTTILSIIKGNSLTIKVSPNPSSGSFSVKAPRNIQWVKVLTMVGEEIYSANENLNDSITLDLNFANDGIYLLECQTTEELFIYKLVIRK